MKITYYGHNCFLMEHGVSVLSDPFITQNEKAAAIDIHQITPEFLLLTHGHFDHVADVEYFTKKDPATRVVGMVEVVGWFEKKGVKRTHGLNFGGSFSFDDDFNAKYVQAHHSSSMPDGSYGGNPGSYIINIGDKTIFLAGDTALHKDLELYREWHDFDLLILPIGGNFTMDFKDAALAAQMMKCKRVLGCHYDTFPVIEIDHQKAKHHFADQGLELELLEIGDSIEWRNL
jgi:L-ascorbate metabolism protein UlaG (beta-lactamase superfamily)